MKDHVSTPEQGQRLKELGWNKPTKFVWYEDWDGPVAPIPGRCDGVPALLSDEALGELPMLIGEYRLTVRKFMGRWDVVYEHCKCQKRELGTLNCIAGDLLTIPATYMLIWAIKQGHVKMGGKV